MTPHRKSYWKTAILAIGGLLVSLGASIVLGAIRMSRVEGHSWLALAQNSLIFWVLFGLCVAGVLVCFAVVLGGAICLYGDAKGRTF